METIGSGGGTVIGPQIERVDEERAAAHHIAVGLEASAFAALGTGVIA